MFALFGVKYFGIDMVVRFCVHGVEPKTGILIPEIQGKAGKKSLERTMFSVWQDLHVCTEVKYQSSQTGMDGFCFYAIHKRVPGYVRLKVAGMWC
jgi:hypothetical protein